MRRLIDRACKIGGWLIFYTHDVTETPSRFGCTPRQWESVVAYAAERAVLPVCDVLAKLPAGSQAGIADGDQRFRQPREALSNQLGARE
jgi:hypothetical protein